jgi:transcription initiation factor IIE alpha subunit
MVQGKPISEEVQRIVVRLSAVMNVDEISAYTEVSVRSVRSILGYFRETGHIKTNKDPAIQLHRVLCDYDIQVCSSFYR